MAVSVAVRVAVVVSVAFRRSPVAVFVALRVAVAVSRSSGRRGRGCVCRGVSGRARRGRREGCGWSSSWGADWRPSGRGSGGGRRPGPSSLELHFDRSPRRGADDLNGSHDPASHRWREYDSHHFRSSRVEVKRPPSEQDRVWWSRLSDQASHHPVSVIRNRER